MWTYRFLGFPDRNEDELKEIARRMANVIAHRGPNGSGTWVDAKTGIALGHRRLAVLDLSSDISLWYRVVVDTCWYLMVKFTIIVVKKALEINGDAPSWRGYSDTETLLAGFDAWGIQSTVEQSIGMFALAVWDRYTKSLTLGRDRLGEKPLYYGWQRQGNDAVFLFGSELKGLRAHPAFENNINRRALSLQLRHSCIPAPYCIYEGISKLLLVVCCRYHCISVSQKLGSIGQVHK